MPQFAPAVLPIGIVFDSDMGNDPDAALTLALLNGLEGKGECRVISVSTTKSSLKSAAYLDLVVRFYMSATTGPVPEFRRIPGIGMSELGYSKEDTPMLQAVLSKPSYKANITKLNDTAEPHALIRNMLSAQTNGNAAVVLDGPATNLARTLALQNVALLIEKKVKYLVVCTAPLKGDIPAARKLFAEWPTPIIAVEPSVGAELKFPAESLTTDFAWSEAHPIADAVKGSGCEGDIPASGMAAAMYAVRSAKQTNWFTLSEPGTLSISDDGTVSLSKEAGRHAFLAVDPTYRDAIVKAYTELASAKPVVRTFRRPKAADEVKVDEKPEDKAKETPKEKTPQP